MNIEVVTPYGKTFADETVHSITLPTKEGVITIMDDHVPLLYVVIPGEIEIKLESGGEFILACSKGIVEVLRDSVVNIMVDTAERAEDIDIERAEEARKRAEEFIANENYVADVDFAKIQAQLEKEMARLNVARRYKNVGRSVTSNE